MNKISTFIAEDPSGSERAETEEPRPCDGAEAGPAPAARVGLADGSLAERAGEPGGAVAEPLGAVLVLGADGAVLAGLHRAGGRLALHDVPAARRVLVQVELHTVQLGNDRPGKVRHWSSAKVFGIAFYVGRVKKKSNLIARTIINIQ